jgi:AraC-like DNA-binding protein
LKLRSRGVSSILVRSIVCAAERRGVDRAQLLRSFGIKPEELDDPDYWFPLGLDLRLLDEAARLSEDPDFGINLAVETVYGAVGLFEYIAASSAVVGQALQRMVQFGRLLADFDWLELRVDDHLTHFRRRYQPSRAQPIRHAAEWFLATAVLRLRRVVGYDWSPDEVRFRHHRPDDTTALDRLFHTRLRFGSAADEMVFDRGFLDTPLCEAPTCFLTEVQMALAQQMRDGKPSLGRLARRLHTSPRTLQRRLKREGTSLQQVLDSTRHKLALRYIADPKVSIVEVALLVGYSSLSSFYAAFQRWTDLSPAEFRRCARPASDVN